MKIKRLNPYLFFILFIGWFSGFSQMKMNSWEEAKKTKSATLDLHWYVSKPFIYQNAKGDIIGIEVELIKAFQAYVKSAYEVEVKLNWIEKNNFGSIAEEIQHKTEYNQFGISAFSITDKRKSAIQFTIPYLADVAVLVSSKGTPIVRTLDGIDDLMKDMTAVTIKGTTYESFLFNLRSQLNLNFEILYIESDKNILDEIAKAEDRFGFIDLPIYLMLIESGGNLTRQNFFTIKGNGYAFIMSKQSDWSVPLNEFLADPKSQKIISAITSKYLGEELFRFINGIYGEDHIGASILTKEKELQLDQIETANQQLRKEKLFQITWIVISIVAISLLLLIILLFYKKQQAAKLLKQQNIKIEQQQESIRNKNDQLNNRNIQLTQLNEEKNNLVKILAHDLRTPINHIRGLLDLLKLSRSELSKDDKKLISDTQDAAMRLNQMISKILDFDALEGNRIKVMVEEISVSQLVNQLLNEITLQAEHKNISLQAEIEEGLILTSDHLFLNQILENLLTNAIKFSEKGTTVKVFAKRSGEFVLFGVEDQGPGLTENDKKLIFKKFQKLSAKPTNGESSTGLGLSIIKKYVDLLHGEVWVESTYGEGSTFYFQLPQKI